MQPTILVDTAALAIPNDLDTEEAVSRLIKTIIQLSHLSREKDCVKVCRLDRALGTLTAANAYPIKKNLQALIELFNLQGVYSVQDVITLYNELLQRMGTIEDSLGVEELECSMVTTQPDILALYDVQEFRSDAEYLIAHGILGLTNAPTKCAPLVGLLVPCSGVPLPFVRATFLSITPAEVATAPASYFDSLPCVDSFDQWLGQSWNPDLIWDNAIDGNHSRLAIAIRAHRFLAENGRGQDFRQSVNFSVGKEFHKSLARNAALRGNPFSSTVFEACWRVIAGAPKETAAKFPLEKYGGQKVRADGARAFRMHVTGGKVGMRLMYWVHKDGKIEFANIGPKGELAIY